MSLLFYDGFDNYTYLPLKWDEYTNFSQFCIKPDVGRKGSSALCALSGYTTISEYIGKILPTDQSDIIIGFAFKKVDPDYGYIEIAFLYDEVIQSSVRLFNTNFYWIRGDSFDSYGKNFTLAYNEWNYFESKINFDTVSGSLDIRINETSVLSVSDFSTSSTFNYINKVRIRNNPIVRLDYDYVYIDDLYIANVSGTYNNDFLGNCHISTYLPSSQGMYSDFYLPNTVSGVANYLMVNEPTYLKDTTIHSETFFIYSGEDDGGFFFNSFYNTSITTSYLTCENRYMGLFFKFSNINIPKNSKILSAKLQVFTEGRYTGSNYIQTFTMCFYKSGVASPTIVDLNDFKNRSTTTTKESFLLYQVDPTTINNSGSLQELVNMADWQEENNSIILKLYNSNNGGGSGSSSPRYNIRQFEYTNEPTSPSTPKLYVEWQQPNDASGTYLYSNDIDKKETYKVTTSGLNEIRAVKYNVVGKRFLDRTNNNDMAIMPILSDDVVTYSGSKLVYKDTNYTCNFSIDEKNPITDLVWSEEDIQTLDFGVVTILQD